MILPLKKTFLITGASNGIGFDLAKIAASEGHDVYAISRNINSLESIKGVKAFSVDITNEKSIELFIAKLIKQKINLDIIINLSLIHI